MDVQRRRRSRDGRPPRAKRIRREDLVGARIWPGTGEFVIDIAVILRQGRVHLNWRRKQVAHDIGLRKYNQVILGSSADPSFRGYLKVLGIAVDVYRIHTRNPMAVKTSDWRSSVTVDMGPIREHGGASAEFENDEYLELYDAEAGLSSVQWSTNDSVHVFVARCLSILGGVDAGKKAAVRLSAPNSPVREFAADDKSFYTHIRKNSSRVAFCRLDLGVYSLVWSVDEDVTKKSDDQVHQIVEANGGIIFRTGETAPVIATIESTGTKDVRSYAAKVMPDLAAIIARSRD